MPIWTSERESEGMQNYKWISTPKAQMVTTFHIWREGGKSKWFRWGLIFTSYKTFEGSNPLEWQGRCFSTFLPKGSIANEPKDLGKVASTFKVNPIGKFPRNCLALNFSFLLVKNLFRNLQIAAIQLKTRLWIKDLSFMARNAKQAIIRVGGKIWNLVFDFIFSGI